MSVTTRLTFVFFLFLFAGSTVLASTWVEYPTNPIYDPVITAEKAYFPTVLKIGANDYRMWYQSNSTSGNSTIAYATSVDGLSWTLVTNQVSGLIPDNAGHPHVEFTEGKFRIWYWNTVSPYTNSAMHYAESTDGITWTNDSAITGDLITATGGLWNSGSYGAVDVIVNDSPTNIGTAVGHANGLTAVDLSPVTVVVAAPGLPNTGFSSDWIKIITLVGVLVLVLVLVYFLRRKQTNTDIKTNKLV